MADERIVRGASLGFENLLYRFTVSSITAEAIYGLCGEADDFAVNKVLGTVLDALSDESISNVLSYFFTRSIYASGHSSLEPAFSAA